MQSSNPDQGGVAKNLSMAEMYYRSASVAGDPRGAYALATMYENGEVASTSDQGDNKTAGMIIAKRYYQRTLELDPDPEVALVVKLALQRMEIKRWAKAKNISYHELEDAMILIAGIMLSLLVGVGGFWIYARFLRRNGGRNENREEE